MKDYFLLSATTESLNFSHFSKLTHVTAGAGWEMGKVLIVNKIISSCLIQCLHNLWNMKKITDGSYIDAS